MKEIEAELIPYHLTGGMATHTRLKQATSSLFGFFSGSLNATTSFTERLHLVVNGPPKPTAESPQGMAIQEIKHFNEDNRIDWSIQSGFAATEYAAALSAHTSYFTDKDVAKFLHDQLMIGKSD